MIISIIETLLAEKIYCQFLTNIITTVNNNTNSKNNINSNSHNSRENEILLPVIDIYLEMLTLKVNSLRHPGILYNVIEYLKTVKLLF